MTVMIQPYSHITTDFPELITASDAIAELKLENM